MRFQICTSSSFIKTIKLLKMFKNIIGMIKIHNSSKVLFGPYYFLGFSLNFFLFISLLYSRSLSTEIQVTVMDALKSWSLLVSASSIFLVLLVLELLIWWELKRNWPTTVEIPQRKKLGDHIWQHHQKFQIQNVGGATIRHSIKTDHSMISHTSDAVYPLMCGQ